MINVKEYRGRVSVNIERVNKTGTMNFREQDDL